MKGRHCVETTDMRNRGSVLIFALLLVILFFGMALALMNLGIETERDVRAEAFTRKALALAESGVNATIHEIIQGVDAGGDGLGNVTRSLERGGYQVTATPRDNEFDLVAVGSYDDYRSTVEVTLVPTFKAISPVGAIGLSGILPPPDAEDFTQQIAQGEVTIDGGNHPAITVQDPGAYGRLLYNTEVLMNSISHYIVPGMFTGQPTVPIRCGDGTVEMPYQQVDEPSINAELLESLRTELYDAVMTRMVPAATRTLRGIRTLEEDVTWGTVAAPEITVVRDDLHIGMGYNVTGSGSLVILGRLNMEHRSSLRWDGDVYVLGDETSGANNSWLRNDGARVDVNGNLLLIETDHSAAELSHVPHEAEHRDIPDIHTTVNGTLMVAHGPYGEIARITTPCGTLTVNGLLAMNGERISIEHLPDAHLVVNGSIQAGLLNGTRSLSSFRLKLIGPSHITYNEELLNKALQGLGRIVDVNLDVSARKKLLGYAQRGWRTRPSG
jgi:hypothetical protein